MRPERSSGGSRGRARRLATIVGIAIAGTLAVTATAGAATAVTLDTRGVLGAEAAGPVTAAPLLSAGQTYVIRVRGTVSIWATSQWAQSGQGCGAAEARPLSPSPGVVNGPAGWDAETVFALPPGIAFRGFRCGADAIPFNIASRTTAGLQFDEGTGFRHLQPLGGPFTAPRADHTYLYRVTGTGQPLLARFADTPVDDNYGLFTIETLTEAECAAQACDAPAAVAPPATSGATTGAPARPTLGGLTQPAGPRACASRRRFSVRIRAPRGVRLASATLIVNGRRSATIRGRRLRGIVDLRGLPRGRFRVEILARTTRGQVLHSVRTYRTCVARTAR